MLHGLIGFRNASDDIELFQILGIVLKKMYRHKQFTVKSLSDCQKISRAIYHGMIDDRIGVGDCDSIQNLQFILKFFFEFIKLNWCREDVTRFLHFFGMIEWLIDGNSTITV